MKLIDTFEILDGVLYSVVFDETSYEGVNEFRRLLNQWTDRDYLTDYFLRNKKQLQSEFWNEVINGHPYDLVEVPNAVNLTIEESAEFEEEILGLANGKAGRGLEKIFIPLHKEIRKESEKHEFKAYGIFENSWLRFYAIEIEGIYFISGGGIKLTKKMEDSEGLSVELEKLKKVYDYLFINPDIDPDLLMKIEG
ncbi:hypothetical protein SAMN03080617_03367 [Algoriphagus alkaliphilus]|uniref:Uncharacterized protein n=1 Tax=Algoriphagus alkaliphilus TaxID=279824 RepID=A0A1G5Z820_9BACT|nr:hypothetical protein [Algoriphagus alkaliphilus]SDA90998.1 hypothetical protein SAMN03080617_03367 [Algoriphagus alkaliphilus]